jgi:FkbM family methyltransferase
MSAWPVYQAILRRYLREPAPFWAAPFRGLVNIAVAVLRRYQGMQFPARNFGTWWWTSRWRLEILLRWHDREAVAFCRSAVRPGMNVVDVGAHMGYYTRLFAELTGPTGKVLAIEPQPDNLVALRHNTRPYRNVQVSGAAAGDQRREATLHWSAGSTNHSLVPGFTDCVNQSTVTVRPLDDLLGELGFERVDFLKIDVEGGEPLVLSGLTQTISRNPQLTILIESNTKALAASGTSQDTLRLQLTAFGLQVRTLNVESAGVENWICSRA